MQNKSGIEKIFSKYISNSDYIQNNGINELTNAIQEVVNEAKEKIWIAVPWFYTKEDDWINSFIKNLCDVSKKGIDIRVFLRPVIENHKTVNALNLAKIRVYSKKSIIRHIHTKMILNENQVFTTTANLTYYDLFRNFNSGIITNDKKVLKNSIKDFYNLFEEEEIEKPEFVDSPIEKVLPKHFVPYFKNRYKKLNPVQTEVTPILLKKNENLLIGAETGVGKTLLAEIAIVKELQNEGSKAIFTAPLKAITVEKEEDWNELHKAGFNVYKITGDEDTVNIQKAKDAKIILTTSEKWDSLTRKPHRFNFVKDISLFVIDEIHILDDEDRGPTTEALLARIKRFNPDARIIGLSATIKNIDILAEWLNADHYLNTTYRPVPLHYSFISVPESKYYLQEEESKDKIILDTVQLLLNEKAEGEKVGKILIFTGSRAKTENTALMLGSNLKINKYVQGRVWNHKLRQCLSLGTAFLHSGLSLNDRKEILNIFNKKDLNVLVATTALAWGVNVAARTVIIRDICIGMNKEPDILSIKQILGRAGRKGKETIGYGIILAPFSKKSKLEEMLLEGKDIESKLVEQILDHINAEINLRYIKKRKDLNEWFKSSFYFYQNRKTKQDMDKFLNEHLKLLLDWGFIKEEDALLETTELGRLTAHWYVRIKTAINLIKRMKNFDYRFDNIENNELQILKILSEEAEELEIFIRSPEEREEIKDFKKANPLLMGSKEESVKICMILDSVLNKRTRLERDEYQVLRESIRLLGFLSQLSKLNGNIPGYVISKDLAKRLQFGEQRGSGRLLDLLLLSTPNNDDKDRLIRTIYERLNNQRINDVESLYFLFNERTNEKNLPEAIFKNINSFPFLKSLQIYGKHLGDEIRLIFQPFNCPTIIFARILKKDGEILHEFNFEEISKGYLDLNKIFRMSENIGLNRFAIELIAVNRFGWDYKKIKSDILIIPSVWRQNLIDELEGYFSSLKDEVISLSFLKRLKLNILKTFSLIKFGLEFVIESKEIKKTANILTRDIRNPEEKINNIALFLKRRYAIAEGKQFRPLINILKTTTGTLDEISILCSSLLKAINVESTLVEIKEKSSKHFLPAFTLNNSSFVLDLFNELSRPDIQIKSMNKEIFKVWKLEFNEDQEVPEECFKYHWLNKYMSTLEKSIEAIELSNYTDEDLKLIEKYTIPNIKQWKIQNKYGSQIHRKESEKIKHKSTLEDNKSKTVNQNYLFAKYPTVCPECKKRIKIGDAIVKGKTRWIHRRCSR